MINTVKAVLSNTLSKRSDPRYILIQLHTGEILDDAQGYGYKSKPNAYKAYAYKQKMKKEGSDYD
ncbi:hypothetical protein AAFA95_002657 [Enterococcus faecalis]|uniref:hypothetical protein n=1 Tax=Enterococcus faecalis TaxID=1351 RepID=UPI000660F207|nr:hypothetical protein [Enterococcus faecalis]EGO2667902.1 hypothetical protein [Enterococcus faecalis]EGO2696231.1 hypothetical protein [Enterococcus faecalis]EGO6066128.1 hypothetical protein [Enterococcus faecalis]EHS7923991.1 hypothetical protein [Enterococcus faecalis]EHY9170633.1 hypothetical protein [Enterococcus faecalis]